MVHLQLKDPFEQLVKSREFLVVPGFYLLRYDHFAGRKKQSTYSILYMALIWSAKNVALQPCWRVFVLL